ncbi:hypothetical protein DAI22_11g068100 [Oryza sativa Japonica Group]|nr:hypothetical protein DAI22_11g068100 [Oryza sativa Japonica Group]
MENPSPIKFAKCILVFGTGIGPMYRAMSLSMSSTLYSPGMWDGCMNAFLTKSSKSSEGMYPTPQSSVAGVWEEAYNPE